VAAVMNWGFISNNLVIKVLSLAVAFILWFLVTAQKPAEQEFPIPLLFKNIRSGLTIVRPHPEKIHISLTGSRMILRKFEKQKNVITLDMQNLKEGPVAFTDFTSYLEIPDGLSLTRISPSVVELRLIKYRQNSLDSHDISGGVK
jgi:YbbR domain-containing protein